MNSISTRPARRGPAGIRLSAIGASLIAVTAIAGLTSAPATAATTPAPVDAAAAAKVAAAKKAAAAKAAAAKKAAAARAAAARAAAARAAAVRAGNARLHASRVFVVGDSLTVGAEPYIINGLGTTVAAVSVNGRVSRPTSEGVSLLSASSPSRIWVVALGTNDEADPVATRRWVETVMARAGKNRKVIWLTLVRPGNYGVVNAELKRQDARYSNMYVIDWATTVARNPQWLGGDGVHLNSTGYRYRGEAIVRAIWTVGRLP